MAVSERRGRPALSIYPVELSTKFSIFVIFVEGTVSPPHQSVPVSGGLTMFKRPFSMALLVGTFNKEKANAGAFSEYCEILSSALVFSA